MVHSCYAVSTLDVNLEIIQWNHFPAMLQHSRHVHWAPTIHSMEQPSCLIGMSNLKNKSSWRISASRALTNVAHASHNGSQGLAHPKSTQPKYSYTDMANAFQRISPHQPHPHLSHFKWCKFPNQNTVTCSNAIFPNTLP